MKGSVIDTKNLDKDLEPIVIINKPSPAAMLSRRDSIALSGRGSFADSIGPSRQSEIFERGNGSDHLIGKITAFGPRASLFGQLRPN